MILCVTPNPAIDRTLHVDALRLGEVHRVEKILAAAGGKGLNVARSIRTLGGDPLCMGLIGGHAGNLLAELAEREGLPAQWTRTRNETRTCVILVQPHQDATVINEPGAEMDKDDCQIFIEESWAQSAEAELVCVSGSLPPGFLLSQYESLLAGFVARRKSVWVDTSGQALRAALNVRGVNIKINASELGEVLGMEIKDFGLALGAARQLEKMGVAQTVITMGEEGALMSFAEGAWSAHPPKIQIVSSTGSGDSFLGGLVFALAEGLEPDVCLRYAVAAGAANALHFGGGQFTQAKFDSIYEQVQIEAVKS
jgi:1-phosphofructokinase family hexose kinase